MHEPLTLIIARPFHFILSVFIQVPLAGLCHECGREVTSTLGQVGLIPLQPKLLEKPSDHCFCVSLSYLEATLTQWEKHSKLSFLACAQTLHSLLNDNHLGVAHYLLVAQAPPAAEFPDLQSLRKSLTALLLAYGRITRLDLGLIQTVKTVLAKEGDEHFDIGGNCLCCLTTNFGKLGIEVQGNLAIIVPRQHLKQHWCSSAQISGHSFLMRHRTGTRTAGQAGSGISYNADVMEAREILKSHYVSMQGAICKR